MCLRGIVKGKDKGQERRFGSYEGLRRQWSRFVRKYGAYITENTVFLERTYDDPAVTREENCLSDICMTVDKDGGWIKMEICVPVRER